MGIFKFHTFSIMHFSPFARLRRSSDTCRTSNEAKFDADLHDATFECKLVRVPPKTLFQEPAPGGWPLSKHWCRTALCEACPVGRKGATWLLVFTSFYGYVDSGHIWHAIMRVPTIL